MYNRYIRNDHGTYTRVQEEDRPASDSREARPPLAPESETLPPESPPPDPKNQTAENHAPGRGGSGSAAPEDSPKPVEDSRKQPAGGPADGAGRFSGGGSGDSLRRMLARFRLENVDTGDLILLMLLFLLFQENADEEVLAALGLLLVL